MSIDEAVKKLFLKLKHKDVTFVLDNILSIDKDKEKENSTNNSLIYTAIFSPGNLEECTISVFKENTYSKDTSEITMDKIEPVRDWFYDSKLWFHKNTTNDEYDLFISYIDEYRDKFTLDLKHPLVSLALNLN